MTITTVPTDRIQCKADEHAVETGHYWDEEAGRRAVRFIETFMTPPSGRLSKKQFRLFPFQAEEIIMPLFSWKRADGTRRFRKGYISVGRQNSKSFICSCIVAFMLLADGEKSPHCCSAACSRDQSKIIFDNLNYAIQRNEELKNACHVVEGRKHIKVPCNGGTYQSLSSESRNALGPSYHCCILDELAFHRNDNLIAAIEPTMAARDQPLILAITTAGTNYAGPGYEWYQYACKVRDSVSEDTSFFQRIWEADEGADVMDVGQWHKANPALAYGLLSKEELHEAALKAKHSNASAVNFSYFRFNRWTQGLTSFISVDRWDQCKGTFPMFPKGTPIYVGLDFGHSRDLCAAVGVIPFEGKYYVMHHAWSPKAAADYREKENRTRYTTFEHEGTLTITPGNSTDYSLIRQWCRNLRTQGFKVVEIVGDPAAGSPETLQALKDQDRFTVYPFHQGPRYFDAPTRRLESLVLDRLIVHDGSDLLRWQCGNMNIRVSGDQIKPSKSKSVDKIDSMTALVQALSRAVGHEVYSPRPSVYNTRGIRWIT